MTFTYHRANGIDDALAWLSSDGAAVLAGGTDLIPLVGTRSKKPEVLVDIKSVPDLRAVSVTHESVCIGAAVTMDEISRLQVQGFDALREGASIIGGAQTRYRATVGGNVCRSSPAGDTLPALLVLGAVLQLRRVGNSREVPISRFFVGPGRNTLKADEMLTAIRLPVTRGGSAYERFTFREAMDLAVLGVAARIVAAEDGTCREAIIAMGALAPTPLVDGRASQVLVGSRCELKDVDSACEVLQESAKPIDDVRASAAYRRGVLKHLASRVISTAYDRAIRN